MRRRPISASRLSLILMVLLPLLPMLGLFLYNGYEQRQAARQNTQAEVERATQLVSGEYDQLIAGTHQLLVALSELPSVQNQDAKGCSTFLANLKSKFSQYVTFGVAGNDGSMFCSAVPMSAPVYVGDRAYYLEAEKNHDLSAGVYQIGRVSGKPSINLGYPVLDAEGRMNGVIFASIDLTYLTQLPQTGQLPLGASLVLVDRNGTVLTRFPDNDQWIGKNITNSALMGEIQNNPGGFFEGTGVDSALGLVGYARLKHTSGPDDALVAVSLPDAVAFAGVNQVLVTNLAWFGLIALLATLAAWGGAYLFFVRQVDEMVQVTKRLAAGDLSARAGVAQPEAGLLGNLAGSINQMGEALQVQRAALGAASATQARRNEELEALYQTSLQINSQLELPELLKAILERSATLLGAPMGGLYLLQPDGDVLELVAGYNLPWDRLGVRLQMGEGASGMVAETGKLLEVEDYQSWAQQAQVYQDSPFRRVLSVPLKVEDRVIGVITITDDQQAGTFDPDEVRLVSLFADQAAIAVAKARLYDQIRRELKERERSEQAQKRLVAELSALHAVALAGNEAATLGDLLERITAIIGEQFYPDDFGVGLLDEAAQTITFHESYRIRSGETIPNIRVGQGIAGWVGQHGVARRVADVQDEPDYLNADPEIRSEVCVPIILGERVLGVINAESKQVDAFSAADERLLTALAGELGIALEKVRLLESEQRRRREAETLRESTAALTSTLDLKQVIDSILSHLERVVPYNSTCVMLKVGDILEITAQRGFQSPDQEINLVFDKIKHIQEVIEQAHPVIIPDVLLDPDWFQVPGSQYIRTWMGIPLIAKNRVIGVINLDKSEADAYTAEDASLAMAFANQAAVAIENARLFEGELQRSQELAAVAHVSAALRHAQTHKAMLPIILDQVMELLQVPAASISMLVEDGKELTIELGRGTWEHCSGRRMPVDASPAGSVLVRSGEPYLNNHLPDDAVLSQNPDLEGLQALLCIPLMAQEQPVGGRRVGPDGVWGMMCVGSQAEIIPKSVRLLKAVGDIASNAINRAMQHEQTLQRVQRLNVLRKVGMTITASIDAKFTLDILLEEIVSNLKMDAADVLLYNAPTYQLEWAAGCGFPSGAAGQARTSLPTLTLSNRDLPHARAVVDREPILVADLKQAGDERSRLLAENGFASAVIVPFISKGAVKGLLEIFSCSPLLMDREWMDFLESLAGQAAISLDNAELFENLERSNNYLATAYDDTIEGWSRALDLRNEDTENHSVRVMVKTMELARVMGLDESQLVQIRRGALLHDIGKMAIPDAILLKPGTLTEEEWKVMRQHPVHAYHLLSPIAYLRPAIDIPYCHHEKWDGSGYPQGLKGKEIPLAARIFAVVDVWDALSTDRPYRLRWPDEQVKTYIREQTGKHFDPQVAETFLSLQGW